MKFVFNCTILYYNTPAFYKVSMVNNTEYFAEALNGNLTSFTLKKQNGQWYGESETSHALAIQIGKHIDGSISSPNNNDHPGATSV